jgi:hypothetical protein
MIVRDPMLLKAAETAVSGGRRLLGLILLLRRP